MQLIYLIFLGVPHLVTDRQAPKQTVNAIERHLRQYTNVAITLKETDFFDNAQKQAPEFRYAILIFNHICQTAAGTDVSVAGLALFARSSCLWLPLKSGIMCIMFGIKLFVLQIKKLI